MSINFAVEQPGRFERALTLLEAGAYPAALGVPSQRQVPLYAMARLPSPEEMILQPPGYTDVVAMNPQRQESMRRLLPQWRF